MGMRTIRWRNGQCPGRNGQWAERIAHAGSEAVRLVPLFQLASCYPRLSSYRILCLSMALAAVPRCGTHHDIVIDRACGEFPAFRRDGATPCRARVLATGLTRRGRAALP